MTNCEHNNTVTDGESIKYCLDCKRNIIRVVANGKPVSVKISRLVHDCLKDGAKCEEQLIKCNTDVGEFEGDCLNPRCGISTHK